MSKIFSSLFATLLLLLSATTTASAFKRGLPWAVDNRYATNFVGKPQIQWYYHWADGPVSQFGSTEFVPMFWGPTSHGWSSWGQRKAEMNKKKPQHLLGFNEPDIQSQANMDPSYAASLYMQELIPWRNKGVLLGSPAIAYNLDWMTKFLNALHSKGGDVDFIVLHWYGSWNNLAGFQKYIQSAHAKFGNKPIWVTEIGITTASKPTQAQVKNFIMHAFSWMQDQGYVQRASWFGAFLTSSPPDGYATGKNALLKSSSQLMDQGYWYSYSSRPNKRSGKFRHNFVREEDEDIDVDGYDGDEIHCDEICKLRHEQVAKWESQMIAPVEASNSTSAD